MRNFPVNEPKSGATVTIEIARHPITIPQSLVAVVYLDTNTLEYQVREGTDIWRYDTFNQARLAYNCLPD